MSDVYDYFDICPWGRRYEEQGVVKKCRRSRDSGFGRREEKSQQPTVKKG